jgi:hypothetical protein
VAALHNVATEKGHAEVTTNPQSLFCRSGIRVDKDERCGADLFRITSVLGSRARPTSSAMIPGLHWHRE